jgi:hypothetical protein
MGNGLLFDLERLFVIGSDVDVEFEAGIVDVNWLDILVGQEFGEFFKFGVGELDEKISRKDDGMSEFAAVTRLANAIELFFGDVQNFLQRGAL